MAWTLIAEGSPEEFGNSTPSISDVPSGTKLRLEMDSNYPIAPLFDLWGMEWVVGYIIDHSGAVITDVEGIGWYKIVVHMTTNSPVVPIILAICTVLSIAGLAYMVHELKLWADIAGPVGATFMAVVAVVALGFLGYTIYQRKTEVIT